MPYIDPRGNNLTVFYSIFWVRENSQILHFCLANAKTTIMGVFFILNSDGDLFRIMSQGF